MCVCMYLFTREKQVTAFYLNFVPTPPFLFPSRIPPDQLYFAILKQKLKSTTERHCFCIDEELAYEK